MFRAVSRDRSANNQSPSALIRGEVDDSAIGPVYAVQHCVVDTFDGQIVLPPTTDQEQAEDLTARLNAAMVEPEEEQVGGEH
jgi:hypothetical protein